MKAGDTQIPYDAQCPHGTYYSYCSICSGARADFERRYLAGDPLEDICPICGEYIMDDDEWTRWETDQLAHLRCVEGEPKS